MSCGIISTKVILKYLCTTVFIYVFSPFLPHYPEFQAIGFAARQRLPSEKGRISVLERASFQGPEGENLCPTLNQRTLDQSERQHPLSQSWMRPVRVTGTASVDPAHC